MSADIYIVLLTIAFVYCFSIESVFHSSEPLLVCSTSGLGTDALLAVCTAVSSGEVVLVVSVFKGSVTIGFVCSDGSSVFICSSKLFSLVSYFDIEETVDVSV